MVQSCFVRPRVIVLLNHVGSDGRTFVAHKNCLPISTLSERTIPQYNRECQPKRRHAHSKRHVSTAVNTAQTERLADEKATMPASTPLSCLPWSNLLRSYAITSISSIPFLLRPSLAAMTFLANSKSRLFNPDHNRILHALLKRAFYVQFCAGETPAEVRRTIDDLKTMGYKGVILGHAREVVLSKEEEEALHSSLDCAAQEECNRREIAQWLGDTLETIKLTQRDDFVALKFTGAGRQALRHLKTTEPCSPQLRGAIHEVCALAQERGVRLLFDAEQASLQQGIDNWTMYYMTQYNKSGKAVVYGTYQAYAKRTPKLLAEHLAEAQKKGFVLGVKLVRGAYIGSDPRELFWDTIEHTHKCYDNLAQCMMQRKYAGVLQPAEGESSGFPDVDFVLASHNANSVRTARAIRDEQARSGQSMIRMAYGQLQGMADHLSCELVKEAEVRQGTMSKSVEIPQTYKYLVWGSLSLSMKYLLRRAQENKDAISRTVDARRALGKEIATRLGLTRP